MTPADIIRAAIPDADIHLVDHVLWGRTPFPMGKITPQSLYKAASSFNRASAKGKVLCDFCEKLARKNDFLCSNCRIFWCQEVEGKRYEDEIKELERQLKFYKEEFYKQQNMTFLQHLITGWKNRR